MTVASHVQELRRKHQALSAAVETAQRNPGMSDIEIARMKKEKLRLKEEISRLTPDAAEGANGTAMRQPAG
ncbi:DUF465 domain-containing protein [Paracoccus sp. S-4012]|uniref:YdcH family protein n=1 Tax=Paracoccus sp. S-4012 TaxID=2665648 RepID=UPI0012B05ED8|nr:YdcH family protein [Paracoccus sp. S-4012]MRX49117.1 DUF465 domain-containing protein [Paracoccus sp. S-4012]